MMNYRNMFDIRAIRCLRMALIVTLVAVASTAFGQFNLKVGYSLGFMSPDVNNSLLQSFNDNLSVNPKYDGFLPAADLKFLYGVSLGVRYKFGIGSLELNWENLGRTISSTGFISPTPPQPEISETEEFRYSLNMLMLTYETSYKSIGVGSSIGRNSVSIKRGTGNSRSSLFNPTDDRSQYFARFHLAFNFYGSSTVAFAIKPFIQVPLSDINLQPFATKVGATNDRFDESFPMFGLSFAFYNGRQ